VKDEQDIILFKASKFGDREAMAALYLKYFGKLLHYGVRIGHNASLVEDCIQDLFVYINENGYRLGEVTKVKAYLFVSIRRRILEKLKSDRKRKENRNEYSAQTNIQFSSNDLRQREVIYLRYFNRLSTSEIAAIMGVANQTILNTLYQTIKKLRSKVHLIDFIFPH